MSRHAPHGPAVNDGKPTLKDFRVKAGLSQWDVAVAVGVSAPLVSLWERNYLRPLDVHFPALFEVLGIEGEDAVSLAPFKRQGRPEYAYNPAA